jgi:hypothetical protein
MPLRYLQIAFFFFDGSLMCPRRRQKRAARMLNSTRENPHLSVNALHGREQTKRCPRTVISNQPRKSIQFDVEYGYPHPTGISHYLDQPLGKKGMTFSFTAMRVLLNRNDSAVIPHTIESLPMDLPSTECNGCPWSSAPTHIDNSA